MYALIRGNNINQRFLLIDDITSWDMVSAADLWDDKHLDGEDGSDQDGYVLVRQDDIVDGIASFMAAYLLSLKETKVCQDCLLM